MRTHRTLIELILDVPDATPGRARTAVKARLAALQDHLRLACEASPITIASVQLWPPHGAEIATGSCDYCQVQVNVRVDVEVSAHERATVELARVRSKIEEYARLALEGSDVRLRRVQTGDVRLKRFYE